MVGESAAEQVRPLLRRTQLLPGESLPSLLERLIQLNYYPHTGVLDWICHGGVENRALRDNIARPKRAQTFLQLARLTQLSPEELFDASAHRFAPVLTLPGKEPVLMPWPDAEYRPMTTSAMAGSYLRSASAAQFCPVCLKTSTYHRLSWTPVAVAICLQHQCLLVHRCPQCDKTISVAEVVRRRCEACQADLSTTQAVSIAGDELGILSQQVIQHWLSVAPAPDLPDCTLPQHPPAVLCRLLAGLSRSLLACQEDWPNLPAPLDGLSERIPVLTHPRQRLTPGQVYHLYRTAFAGIVDWPQGLFRFLDAYSRRSSASQTSSRMKSRFGTLWHGWLRHTWRRPEYEFVQRCFVDYLTTREIPLPPGLVDRFKERPWFVARTGLWTEERTAQVLGISVRGLRRFFLYGALGTCLWPHCRRSQPMFERVKVLAVRREWKAGWPMRYACSWLGLAEADVVKLAQVGTLTVECELEDGDVRTEWVLNRQSVEAFFEGVACQLEVYQGDPYDLTPLRDVARSLAYAGVDRVTLLQGVADGTLPAYKREPELQNLAHVCFLDAMLSALPDKLYAERGWVAGHRFAWQKGFAPRLVTEWVEAGRIEPVATFECDYRYFELQSLEQLATECGVIS